METTEEDRWPLPLAEHPALEMEADFAALTMVPLREGEEPFLEARTRHGRRLQLEVAGEGGTTRVRVGHSGTFWGGWEAGGARLVAHVPRDVRARVRSSAGRIHVEHLEGCTLDIEADASRISLEDVGGALRVHSDAGRIDGVAIRGRLDFGSSAGAIRLEVAALDPGQHRVETNVGSLRLELARGLPVRIDSKTSMGSSKVDFPSTRDAEAVLELSADVGAIRVRESHRRYEASQMAPYPPWPAGPYRAPQAGATPGVTQEELDAILERVAAGSLSPADASALLRALRTP